MSKRNATRLETIEAGIRHAHDLAARKGTNVGVWDDGELTYVRTIREGAPEGAELVAFIQAGTHTRPDPYAKLRQTFRETSVFGRPGEIPSVDEFDTANEYEQALKRAQRDES